MSERSESVIGWLLIVVIVGGVAALLWNAYLRPYHGPTAEDFAVRVEAAATCESLYPVRRSVDSAQREGGMTETQWQSLQDEIGDRARMLRPQVPAGEAELLCADLIVPCLPRGAVCYPDLSR